MIRIYGGVRRISMPRNPDGCEYAKYKPTHLAFGRQRPDFFLFIGIIFLQGLPVTTELAFDGSNPLEDRSY